MGARSAGARITQDDFSRKALDTRAQRTLSEPPDAGHFTSTCCTLAIARFIGNLSTRPATIKLRHAPHDGMGEGT